MNALAGTRGLARLILRRDRIVLPLWIVALSALPVTYARSFQGLYPTAAGLEAYRHSISTNPTFLALLGPPFGSSVGALGTWRASLAMTFVALASLLTVIRHTRAEEEAGRRELLGSTVVGRQAPLAAALSVTGAADVVLGLLVALWMIGIGTPVAGAVALGASWTVAGWMFAAVGGVAAQLTQSAGAARGLAIAVMGGAYLLRVAGDARGPGNGAEWLSWLSPFGLLQRVRPYAGERWWPIGLALAATVVVAMVGFALSARRDVGAGVFAPRPGPATAALRLRSPLALAWRLHRGLLAGWVAGLAAGGAVIGASAQSVQEMVDQSPGLSDFMRRLGGAGAITDAYFAGVLNFLALAVAAYAIQATLRARAEETALRAEPVLATAVGRVRWLASHLVFGLVGPVLLLVALGMGAGLAHGVAIGDVGGQVSRVLGGALVQVPAVWVLCGLALAMFGLLPGHTWVAWAALASAVFLGQVGSLLQLDQRVLDVSPFTHIPRIPGADLTAQPLLWLAAATVVLIAAGLVGFRRRDIG